MASNNRIENRLLRRLPDEDYQRLWQQGEMVSLLRHEEVYRQYGPLSHVYFPADGVISTALVVESGDSIEAALIGPEGMLGIHAVLGLDFSPVIATSQISCRCLRLPLRSLLGLLKLNLSLERLLRRYAAYSLVYAHHTAACNALHSVGQRLCRWLLMIQDRVRMKAEFPMTHEFLAAVLGVRRPTISIAAGSLQAAGLLTYRRGIIQIVNRKGLEAASCECYEATNSLYERILMQ